MSLEAYIWAANLPLSQCNGTSHRVLLKLADRADAHGYGAFPSAASMAEDLECSERTVRRALRDLLDLGLIRHGDQRYVAHYPPNYRPTVYDVMTIALMYRESRGDIHVIPSDTRHDRKGRSGVTTGVTQTVHKPTYQDSISNLTYPTARESVMSR